MTPKKKTPHRPQTIMKTQGDCHRATNHQWHEIFHLFYVSQTNMQFYTIKLYFLQKKENRIDLKLPSGLVKDMIIINHMEVL